MSKREIINLVAMAAILLAMFTVLVFYGNYIDEKYGVYTIAKFVRYEGDPEGSTSVYEVYFNNKATIINSTRGFHLIEGKFYFMKLSQMKVALLILLFMVKFLTASSSKNCQQKVGRKYQSANEANW